MNEKKAKMLRGTAKGLTRKSGRQLLAVNAGTGRQVIINDPETFRGAYRSLKRGHLPKPLLRAQGG